MNIEVNHEVNHCCETKDSSPAPQRRLVKDLKEGILKDGLSTAPTGVFFSLTITHLIISF